MELSMSWWSAAAVVLLVTLAAALLLDPLVAPILHPIVLPFPWPAPASDAERRRDAARTVVFAASFNPPHRGHRAMLAYLARRYGTVWVVIGRNPGKAYAVSPEERARLVRAMLADGEDGGDGDQGATAGNVRVAVVEGYVWRTVLREGAELFFRGVRTWEKDGAEERALQILNTWGPLVLGPLWWPIPTVFLQGDPAYNHVSSTLVREICQTEADKKRMVRKLEELVPKAIAKDVAALYGGEKKKKN